MAGISQTSHIHQPDVTENGVIDSMDIKYMSNVNEHHIISIMTR